MLKNRYQFVAGAMGAILFVVFNATVVHACSCPAIEVKERVEVMRKTADAIFTGTVRSVETIKANSYKVVLSVETSWIEEDTDKYTIYTSGTLPGGCGVSFLKARSYLVYAKKDKEDRLVTEICWGTREISLAKEDLKSLGKPVAIFTRSRNIEGDDASIRVIEAVAPIFPATAIATDQEGRIAVNVTLSKSGEVVSAEVIDAPANLRKVSEIAATRWRFSPSSDGADGRVVRLVFVFTLVSSDTSPEKLLPIFRPPYEVEVRARVPVVSRDASLDN